VQLFLKAQAGFAGQKLKAFSGVVLQVPKCEISVNPHQEKHTIFTS
jgi:hypothetical protein